MFSKTWLPLSFVRSLTSAANMLLGMIEAGTRVAPGAAPYICVGKIEPELTPGDVRPSAPTCSKQAYEIFSNLMLSGNASGLWSTSGSRIVTVCHRKQSRHRIRTVPEVITISALIRSFFADRICTKSLRVFVSRPHNAKSGLRLQKHLISNSELEGIDLRREEAVEHRHEVRRP
jgi:hypothetical protein